MSLAYPIMQCCDSTMEDSLSADIFFSYLTHYCLTLMLLLTNLADDAKILAHGYSSESIQQELSNEYQHDRVLDVYTQITTINTYSLIEIGHTILRQCHVVCIEMEKNQLYTLNWHLKKFLTKSFGCPEGWFLMVCVSKWRPDALLAKPMHDYISLPCGYYC